MPLDSQVLSKVSTILHQIVPDISETALHPNASLINDLAIDSLKVAELSLLLEQTFKQTFFLPDWLTSEENPEDLTIASLVQFLSENLDESH